MAITVEIATESFSAPILGIGNGSPDIGRFTIELEVFIQHILIQDNVVYQLIILAFGHTWIFIGDFSQVRQLRTVLNEVRIILRSRSTGKRFGNRAVPYGLRIQCCERQQDGCQQQQKEFRCLFHISLVYCY